MARSVRTACAVSECAQQRAESRCDGQVPAHGSLVAGGCRQTVACSMFFGPLNVGFVAAAQTHRCAVEQLEQRGVRRNHLGEETTAPSMRPLHAPVPRGGL